MMNGGFVAQTFIYDATTHALVGASRSSDVSSLTCGANHVFSLGAGRFPAPECVKAEIAGRCAPRTKAAGKSDDGRVVG
jgi:hypothetical protein